jgi:hypothetical protein
MPVTRDEPKLDRNDKRGITIARGTAREGHLSVPEDWIQKWESRERELHACLLEVRYPLSSCRG